MPEAPDNPPRNPFAATGVGVHYDRGRPYHHGRTLERVVAMVGGGRVTRGIDIACGTGMSTVALAGHADSVFGVDVSPEMMRAARAAPGVRYLLGRAELLPFRDGSSEAATCCSGVHWFDQPRFFAELRRVLRSGSWVALYDHYFIGEMVDVPEFGDWLLEALRRYPLPPRSPQVGDPRSIEPAGFEKLGDEFFADDIEMTHDQLVEYQLTISNFVDAIERGSSRAEVEAWVRETSAPLFEGAARRTVRFLGSITCFRRSA